MHLILYYHFIILFYFILLCFFPYRLSRGLNYMNCSVNLFFLISINILNSLSYNCYVQTSFLQRLFDFWLRCLYRTCFIRIWCQFNFMYCRHFFILSDLIPKHIYRERNTVRQRQTDRDRDRKSVCVCIVCAMGTLSVFSIINFINFGQALCFRFYVLCSSLS